MLEIIGRFHPVILHLPIGIFVFVFLLELLSKLGNEKEYRKAISIGLLSGVCFAIFSCATGLLLADGGDYVGETVKWHKWFGLAFTFLAIILYVLNRRKLEAKDSKLYFPLFVLIMILMTITGHKGGSITHGEGFLFADKEEEIVLENINDAFAYEHIIAPIFKSKCNSCHNSSKAKGKLIMTTSEELMKGGENGVVLVAGKPKKSPLINRIHLPLDEKEHMPPKSKKQLSDDEVVLLEWWIKEGASFDSRVGDMNANDNVSAILEKYAKPKESSLASKVEPAKSSTLQKLRRNGIPAYPIATDNPLVHVDLAHDQNLNRSRLNELKGISEQITYLNLGFTNAEDNMLPVLGKLPHLQNLQLQKTKISDDALNHVKGSSHLEILNLYGTQVTDEILDVLLSLRSLKSVYLWETAVTDELVSKLQKERPLLAINYKIDSDIFGDASLKPPTIVAEKELFSDSLTIELKLNFKNVQFHYTLDGTMPDTLSPIYESPIVITETAMIRAISNKSGWGKSEPVEKQFVKTKYTVESIVLADLPSPKYAGDGPRTLTDFVKGNTEFRVGNWVGYESGNLVATLDLGEKKEVTSITVSALESTGAWIFHPRGISVSTSDDGVNFDKKIDTSYPVVQFSEPPSTKNFTELITPTEARYVKVRVKRNPTNPDWHPNPGGNSWLFVDEIVVN